jgi:hypothetical protein
MNFPGDYRISSLSDAVFILNFTTDDMPEPMNMSRISSLSEPVLMLSFTGDDDDDGLPCVYRWPQSRYHNNVNPEVEDFINDAKAGILKLHNVMSAVLSPGFSVNDKWNDGSALHAAVAYQRTKLIQRLFSVGGDANGCLGLAASNSNVHTLQEIIFGGGSINETNIRGQTPLITLVQTGFNDVSARLRMLLACPELDIDAQYRRRTAERWAARIKGRGKLLEAITKERRKRMRWTQIRISWIAAITPQ